MSHDHDRPAQPKILLTVTDQHRADHTGFAGNAIVKTLTTSFICHTQSPLRGCRYMARFRFEGHQQQGHKS